MTGRHPAVDLTAHCACGALTVTVAGQVRSMLMCACRDCQRATGSGHSALFLVDAGAASVVGETRGFDVTAASGATFTRTFCPTCGTPISGRSSRAPQLLALPAGLFGPDTGWFAPRQLIFARSHLPWDAIAADLPRHATYPQR